LNQTGRSLQSLKARTAATGDMSKKSVIFDQATGLYILSAFIQCSLFCISLSHLILLFFGYLSWVMADMSGQGRFLILVDQALRDIAFFG